MDQVNDRGRDQCDGGEDADRTGRVELLERLGRPLVRGERGAVLLGDAVVEDLTADEPCSAGGPERRP